MRLAQFFEQVFLPEMLASNCQEHRDRHVRAIAQFASIHGELEILAITDGILEAVPSKRYRQMLRRMLTYASHKGHACPASAMSPTWGNETKGPLKGHRRDLEARQQLDGYAQAGELVIESVDELQKLVSYCARRNIQGAIKLTCTLKIEVKHDPITR